MEQIASSSFLDYGRSYLEREAKKYGPGSLATPATAAEMQSHFEIHCPGKYRTWFPHGRWSIGRLSLEEFKKLMVLDAAETRRESLVIERLPRTLNNAAENAIASGYFEVMRRGREKHFWYYLSYVYGSLNLKGADRLVVCTLGQDEKRGPPPETYSYYLHDGWGRALPYMVMVLQKRLEYQPVEVLLAEEL